jgi:phage shock protein A
VLIARQRTAQVRIEVYRYLDIGQSDFGASQARFDRMADRLGRRVEELVAEADLHDLTGLETEFVDLERQLAIDRELEAMKHDRPEEGRQGGAD